MTDLPVVPRETSAQSIQFSANIATELVRLPATPGLSEIWFSAAAGHDANCAYNETYSVRLKGPFNETALVQSLTKLADLHPVLRGHFAADGEEFVISPTLPLAVHRRDFSALPQSEREDAIEQLISSDAQTPYDLQCGPLYRANIIRLSQSECVLLLGIHQAICDDLSIELLLADLGQLYGAQLGLRPQPLSPKSSFADYANNCRTLDYLRKYGASRNYWQECFDTLPADLELPYDGRRPKRRSYAAHHVAHPASTQLLDIVREFARSSGLESHAICLASLAALLHRLSGSLDLVIGVPVPGHVATGFARCVGPCVTLVPIRFRFTPEQSFIELCQHAQSALHLAQEHAAISFGQLVSDLNVTRDPARIPLVSVLFSHTVKSAADEVRFRDCSTEYEQNARSFEIFELNLNINESPAGLLLRCHANADLYSRAWLQRRLGELERLLGDGCAEPTKPVANLTLLDYAQFARISQFSNNFGQTYSSHQLIPELFEAQADRTPSAVAIRSGDRTIDYLGLDHRANQFAHALRRRGVGRGKMVGICINRSIDMVAAVLGALKAGAAYIPLDPAFPPGRLRHMIEDSGLSLVVSETSLARCHCCEPDRTLNFDDDEGAVAEESTARLNRDAQSAQSEDAAYLIYTSGSTGMPKGVSVHHRAAVNFLTSMQAKPGLSAQDRLLAVTTLSFDIAVLELFLPLSVGAQIVLASRDDVVDGSRLLQLLESTRATLMQATPVSWRLLLEAGWRGAPGFKALCGGEPLPFDLAEALVSRVGQLWNMYGPTETTVWSTCCRILDPRRGITVGKPINNTSIWILDAKLQPCPIGVPGEIHIGGDGVALGYFNRPELTGERFISNPYDPNLNARMYKTGDIGRWRDSGELECLGRSDSQVKVRGFRIELGEIEAALAEVPGVAKAAVVARGKPENVQLVAYIVVELGFIGEATARELLRSRLPDYMVPAVFVRLDAFPQTPNGKLDRKALPDPDVMAAPPQDIALPEGALEKQLLELWQEELGRSPISVTSSFFELGGHSLLAVRIFNAIYRQHGVRLHIATLVEYPTVRKLAQRIGELMDNETTAAESTWSTVVPLQTRGELPPLFCIAGLGGNPLNLRHLAKALRMNQPFYGLQHRGVDGAQPPHRDIASMAAEFLEDIRNVQPHGPYYLAGYSTGGVAAYELARQLVARGEAVDAVILLDSYNPTCLTWSLTARIEAHVARIRRAGLKYVWSRATASVLRHVRETQRSIRAQLAQLKSYEYRQDAVVEATLEAERNYVPQPISAAIFLAKADFTTPEHDGIGYPPHESNGWREIDRGNLKVVQVQCNHEDLVSERVAPTTGAIVRHILRTAQAKRANEEPPPPSVLPDWLKSGAIPYYVPKGTDALNQSG